MWIRRNISIHWLHPEVDRIFGEAEAVWKVGSDFDPTRIISWKS